jgi:predicted nucleic acid-binding Zn ribbon protein
MIFTKDREDHEDAVFCAVAIGPRDQPWVCSEETRNGMQVGKKNDFHKRSRRSRR